MRRAKFSWIIHWREQYALGEIDLAEFERLVGHALRVEAGAGSLFADGIKRAGELKWSAAAARKAANYTAGIAASQARFSDAL